MVTGTSFSPDFLTTNATYYWRVDAVNDVGTTSGTVWSFTTEARLTPEQFAILAWDGPTRTWSKTYTVGVCDTIRDCGFNLAGFVEKDKLDNVAAAGLKAIVFDYNTSPLSENMLNFPDSTINYWVNWLVDQVKNHPANFGYYLRDEPGSDTWWGLGRWRAAFKAADPTKLAYMSLGWAYDFTNYISVTGQNDFLSYDFYGCEEGGTVNPYYFPCLENVLDASKTSGCRSGTLWPRSRCKLPMASRLRRPPLRPICGSRPTRLWPMALRGSHGLPISPDLRWRQLFMIKKRPSGTICRMSICRYTASGRCMLA
jgi:hypothetical protein